MGGKEYCPRIITGFEKSFLEERSAPKLNVTACLITWKRQQNIPKIVESLLQWPFIDEIIIRDNSKARNVINYGRYLSAEKAKNKIIYIQDDDCLVKNLDEVYEAFLKDPTAICHSGTEDYQKVIPENIYGKSQMAMAGWGSFFQKTWLPYLNRYTKVYGHDYCFYRETDRIFSLLMEKHHNFVLGDIVHLEGKDDENALCNQPDHLKYKQMAIERCLKLLS